MSVPVRLDSLEEVNEEREITSILFSVQTNVFVLPVLMKAAQASLSLISIIRSVCMK